MSQLTLMGLSLIVTIAGNAVLLALLYRRVQKLEANYLRLEWNDLQLAQAYTYLRTVNQGPITGGAMH